MTDLKEIQRFEQRSLQFSANGRPTSEELPTALIIIGLLITLGVVQWFKQLSKKRLRTEIFVCRRCTIDYRRGKAFAELATMILKALSNSWARDLAFSLSLKKSRYEM